MASASDTLPRRIISFAIAGMLITVLLVGMITTIPLYHIAKTEADNGLRRNAHARAMVVSEHLEHFSNVAQQIASRTHARKQLAAYNRGELSQLKLEAIVAPILDDALRQSQGVAGIIRLDAKGEAVVIVGMPISTHDWPELKPGAKRPYFSSPFTVNGHSFLVVVAPILDRQGGFVGTDLVIFRLAGLWALLEDRSGLGNSGRLMLGRSDGEDLWLFGTVGASNVPATFGANEDGRLALIRATRGDSGLLLGEDPSGVKVVSAYEGIDLSQWGLALSMDADELYAPANRQLRYTGIAVLLLMMVGSVGVLALTRPLIGRIVVDTDELSRQIEEKAAELAASRETLAEAQRLAHIGSFEWDLRNGEVSWSEELFRIVGMPVDSQVPNRDTFLSFVHPHDRPQVQATTERVLGRAERTALSHRIVTPKGEERVIRQLLESRAASDGQPISVIGTVQDVTEQYHVERVMRSLAQAASLGGRDEFFIGCVRNLAAVYGVKHALIGLLNEDGATVTTQYLWLNNQLVDNLTYRLAGTPCEDIILQNRGLISSKVCQHYPEDQMLVEMGIESYFGAPLLGSDGKPLGLVSILHSEPLHITPLMEPILGVFASRIAVELERGWAEERLARFNDSLEQRIEKRTRELQLANRELEAYSYSIAHDLRAPLRSVISFSQVVLADAADKLGEEDVVNLQRVIKAGKHMARLIDDILELSRISRTDLRLAPVDLGALAVGQLERLSEHDPGRRVDWRVQPGLQVQGDATLLGIMMQNLLANAWKFTAREVLACIEVGCRQDGDERVFWVRDNGVGFDMQYADKLFQTFQRLHNREEFAGTGVGLATVRRIIERHHGRVWIEASPGEGATVFFTLPA